MYPTTESNFFLTHRSTAEGLAAAAGAAAATGALVSFFVFVTATLAAGAAWPSSSESPKAAKKFFDYRICKTKSTNSLSFHRQTHKQRHNDSGTRKSANQ
jgi:hypothetical protein